MSAAPIECPKYEPLTGSRRCRHFVANGGCAREDMFMCTEWLRANPHLRPEASVPGPTQARLAPGPKPGIEGSERGAPPRALTQSQVVGVRAISDEALEAFRALGLEIGLSVSETDSVWIVPEYSGAERVELRVDHAATLAALCAAVPGARVTHVRRRPPEPTAPPEAR